MKIFCALSLCLLVSHTASAHIGDRIFPIFELTDADLAALDLHDGSLNEWEALFPNPSLTATDFTVLPNVGTAAPYNPADMDYRIWMAWNGSTSQLYFAMERLDNVYINTYSGDNLDNLWRYDSSITFIIDADHSGGAFTGSADPTWTDEEKTLNNNRTAQRYQAIAQAPDGRHIGYAGAASNWVTLPPYADGIGQVQPIPETDSGVRSVLEFYLTPFDDLIWHSPDNSVPAVLTANQIIGFDLSVPDFDTTEPFEYHTLHNLSQGADTWRHANQFVDGLLVPATSQTAVETNTWARIKASLMND